MTIHDDLRDLVGNPVPPTDLAQRARNRGGEIKRRRMAGIATSVVAVTVIAVPGAFLVRAGSGSVNGAPGSGGTSPSAAATTGVTTLQPVTTTLVPGTPSAAYQTRIAKALSLLGNGFTQTSTGILMDPATGVVLGAAATFTETAGGGTVAVTWSDAATTVTLGKVLTAVGPVPSAGALSSVGPVPALASAAAVLPSGAPGSVTTFTGITNGEAVASAVPSASTFVTSGGVSGRSTGTGPETRAAAGTVATDGKQAVSVRVVQGKPGSPKILPGRAAITFANKLLKAG